MFVCLYIIVIFSSLDQTSVETISSVESYGPQNTPNSSFEIPLFTVDEQIQEFPDDLSEEETVCPLAENPSQDMVLIIGSKFILIMAA